MINCDLCGDEIGSMAEPIFAANNGQVVCEECCCAVEGEYPLADRAEYDTSSVDVPDYEEDEYQDEELFSTFREPGWIAMHLTKSTNGGTW